MARSRGRPRPTARHPPHAFPRAKIRAASHARAPERLLERLGKIDTLEGDIGELLALVDRYIFSEEGAESAPARPARPSTRAEADASTDAPFGPRGVSIGALDERTGRLQRSIADLDVSEIISILIRDLSDAPKDADGDAPNRDPEDPGGRSDGAAPEEETSDDARGVDWERLVTACRRRISGMVNKLRKRLAEPIRDVRRATWLFERMLTILSLLRKLRERAPPPEMHVRGRGRPESLVSTDQLRAAFKASMAALYRRDGGIAAWIEGSAEHRAAHERAKLDAILLWAARDIGADAEAQPAFGEGDDERLRRLADKADAVVVAMSAAAHPALAANALKTEARSAWRDAVTVPPGWEERHARLGAALQRLAASRGTPPTVSRPATPGDIVAWKAEPLFPRVVWAASGGKAVLIGPGAEDKERTIALIRTSVMPRAVDALLSNPTDAR